MRLSRKKALVTGAASGIGKAVVAALLQEGASVLSADIEYKGYAPEDTGSSGCRELDVTKEDDWERLVLHTNTLDVLVACAGISDVRSISETSLADWRRVLDANLDGAFLSVKYGARMMQQNGGGSIVIIGSASGVKAAPGASAYCVSKAGVRMLVRVAALELKPHAIRVNSISPAAVITPMWQRMPFWSGLVEKHGSEDEVWKALGGIDRATPSIQRMAFPEEIAAAVLFLSCNESAHITGTDLLVDAGYTL